jgi:hypothetical protein
MKNEEQGFNPKYQKMIKEISADVVFELQASALECAWNSIPIPIEYWEDIMSEQVEELVCDILADKLNEIADRLEHPLRTEVHFIKVLYNAFKRFFNYQISNLWRRNE